MKTAEITSSDILDLSKFFIKKTGIDTIKNRYGIPDDEKILLFWSADLFDTIYEIRKSQERKRVAGLNTGWKIKMENGIVLTDVNLYYLNLINCPSAHYMPTSSIQDIEVSATSDMMIYINSGVFEAIPNSLFFPKGKIEKPDSVKKETIIAIATAVHSFIQKPC